MAHASPGTIPGGVPPFEAFPSTTAVPRHRGRFPLAIRFAAVHLRRASSPRGGGHAEACCCVPWPQGFAPSSSPLRPAGVAASQAPDASMGFRTHPGSLTRDTMAFRAGARVPRHLRQRRGRRSCSLARRIGWCLGEPWHRARSRTSLTAFLRFRTASGPVSLTRPGLPAPEGVSVLEGAPRGGRESAWDATSSSRIASRGPRCLFLRCRVPSCPRTRWVRHRRASTRTAPSFTAEAVVRASRAPQARSAPKRRPLRRVRAPKCRRPCSLRPIPALFGERHPQAGAMRRTILRSDARPPAPERCGLRSRVPARRNGREPRFPRRGRRHRTSGDGGARSRGMVGTGPRRPTCGAGCRESSWRASSTLQRRRGYAGRLRSRSPGRRARSEPASRSFSDLGSPGVGAPPERGALGTGPLRPCCRQRAFGLRQRVLGGQGAVPEGPSTLDE